MPQPVTYRELSSPVDIATIQIRREALIQAVAKYAQPNYQKAFWQIQIPSFLTLAYGR
jgi:hypothetical protein